MEHARKKTRDDAGIADVWQFLFNFEMPMPKLWLPRQVSINCGLINLAGGGSAILSAFALMRQ